MLAGSQHRPASSFILAKALEAAVKAYIAEHGIEAFKALPMFGSAKIGEAK